MRSRSGSELIRRSGRRDSKRPDPHHVGRRASVCGHCVRCPLRPLASGTGNLATTLDGAMQNGPCRKYNGFMNFTSGLIIPNQ